MSWKDRRLWLESTMFEIEIIEGLRMLIMTMRVKWLRQQDHYKKES